MNITYQPPRYQTKKYCNLVTWIFLSLRTFACSKFEFIDCTVIKTFLFWLAIAMTIIIDTQLKSPLYRTQSICLSRLYASDGMEVCWWISHEPFPLQKADKVKGYVHLFLKNFMIATKLPPLIKYIETAFTTS